MIPSTAIPENFEVYDVAQNKAIEVKEVLYVPLENRIVLTVEPNILYGLDCRTVLKPGLIYEDNTSPDNKKISGEISPESICTPYDVSIQSLKLYDSNNNNIFKILPFESFKVKATIINATDEQQVRRLVLYRNEALNSEIFSKIITVEANKTLTLVCSVGGMNWGSEDILSARLLNE